MVARFGKRLAFRLRESLSQIIQTKQKHGAAVDLYRMPAAGGPGMTNLTAEWEPIPDAPSFSPDGKSIHFAAAEGGDTANASARLAAGGVVEQLTHGTEEPGLASLLFPRRSTGWRSPGVVGLRHPAEAFAARPDGSGEKRLSALNEAFLNEVDSGLALSASHFS